MARRRRFILRSLPRRFPHRTAAYSSQLARANDDAIYFLARCLAQTRHRRRARRYLWRCLRCGYKPLRGWERLFAYVSFVTLTTLTWHQANVEGISLRLALYTVTMLIAVPCAFVAFWDARVTARLRRREWKQKQEIRRLMTSAPQVVEAEFSNTTGDWSYFSDPAPTTL